MTDVRGQANCVCRWQPWVGVKQGIAVALLDTVELEIVFCVDRVIVSAVVDDGARQDGQVTRR